jgi:hypothetical protein
MGENSRCSVGGKKKKGRFEPLESCLRSQFDCLTKKPEEDPSGVKIELVSADNTDRQTRD